MPEEESKVAKEVELFLENYPSLLNKDEFSISTDHDSCRLEWTENIGDELVNKSLDFIGDGTILYIRVVSINSGDFYLNLLKD